MNFDSFKMYYVFSNKVNTPIIFKDNGSSYISFEIENCTYSKLFLVSDFYWNKDSDNYNSIEYNLKKQNYIYLCYLYHLNHKFLSFHYFHCLFHIRLSEILLLKI